MLRKTRPFAMLNKTATRGIVELLNETFFTGDLMTRFLSGAVLALGLSCVPAVAQPPACDGAVCVSNIYLLRSVSAAHNYAVLVSLPDDAPCDLARFVVSDADHRPLGQTDALAPGEQGRVRIGQGYDTGVHPLRVVVSGCAARPEGIRAIRVGRASPDHGWRALHVVLAAADGVSP
jgi:hypothetical protein